MTGCIRTIVLLNYRLSRETVTPADGKGTCFPDRTLETVEAINREVLLSVYYDEAGDILQGFFCDC